MKIWLYIILSINLYFINKNIVLLISKLMRLIKREFRFLRNFNVFFVVFVLKVGKKKIYRF